MTSMTGVVRPVVLRNGTRIDDPVSCALEFVARDASYRRYDQQIVAHDNCLLETDIRVANGIGARMGDRTVHAVIQRGAEINAALSRIDLDASLCSLASAIPWRQLESLYAAIAGAWGIGLARATKILHKKRPALIPILDSVVGGYLRSVDPVPDGSPPRVWLALTGGYKAEIDANLEALTQARSLLLARGINLTEVRLLDVFVWAYSGTYRPVWTRGNSAAPQHPLAPGGERG